MPTTEIKTAAEVAERLGVSLRTLMRWTAEGRIKAARQSAPWLYDETEVDKLADEIAGELEARLARLGTAS